MARHHRFYRHARDFGIVKAATLIGLLVLTQALATLESDPEEEASIRALQTPQVVHASGSPAEAAALAGPLI